MKKLGYLFKRLAGICSMLVWLMSQITPPIHSSDHGIGSCMAISTHDAIVESASEHMPGGPDEALQKRSSQAYSKLSRYFEPNYGQTDSQAKFLSRGDGYSLFLTSTEAVLSLTREDRYNPLLRRRNRSRLFRQRMHAKATQLPIELGCQCESRKTASVRMRMVGANAEPFIEGVERLPGISNYFIGNDPGKWRTNIPHYAGVKYHGVYPGADLVYYSNEGRLEFDFILAPGAEANAIKLSFEGAQQLDVDDRGDLVLITEAGEVRYHKPVVYQEIDGIKSEIAARFIIHSKGEVGFELGAYDMTRPLVIDPVLSYSTYFVGFGLQVAVDPSGNLYVTGVAFANFPTTPGVFQTAPVGDSDAFVTKLNASGSALIYSTYLGGSDSDEGSGIAVDSSGNAYVAGDTESRDFPTTPGAYRGLSLGNDPFVAKLNGAGTALIYSTYLGPASKTELTQGIALDSAGNAYVIGSTDSTDLFTTQGAFQKTLGGQDDAFVIKLNASGSALVYSTYLGGKDDEDFLSIAVDSSGNAYATGSTSSTNFPTTPSAFQRGIRTGGVFMSDAFVAKLNSTGTGLMYSSYLGGSEDEEGADIAVDSSGNAYITGTTESPDFPVTETAFQKTYGGFLDVFVAKINTKTSGITSLVYSTYLGGSNEDEVFAFGIAVDSSGNVYVAGDTESADFPTRFPIQPINGGLFFADAFVTEINASGSALIYSTYLGGRGDDMALDIALDSSGNLYALGDTGSPDFPTTAGALQTTKEGSFNRFLVKIEATLETGGFRITNASVILGQLFVVGEGFSDGAVILLNGEQQGTKNKRQDPTVLFSKKGDKKIKPGQTVTIQVQNPDGRLSEPFRFTRPIR